MRADAEDKVAEVKRRIAMLRIEGIVKKQTTRLKL